MDLLCLLKNFFELNIVNHHFKIYLITDNKDTITTIFLLYINKLNLKKLTKTCVKLNLESENYFYYMFFKYANILTNCINIFVLAF